MNQFQSQEQTTTYSRRTRYSVGMAWCPSCYRYIDTVLQAREIVDSPGGLHFHSTKFCNVSTMYPRRLRYKSHTRKARRRRQAMATYY